MRICRSPLVIVLLVVVSPWLSVTSAQTTADPLATLRAEHPRLLFLADDQQQIQDLAKTDALLARLIEQN